MQSPQYDYLDADIERRFDNSYNIYDDPLYIAWLGHEHPDSLPDLLYLTAEESQINDQVASDLMSTSAEAASGSSLDNSSRSESLSSCFATTR